MVVKYNFDLGLVVINVYLGLVELVKVWIVWIIELNFFEMNVL